MSNIDFQSVVAKFDELVGRGFCSGAGDSPDGKVCVEQAVAIAMGLEFNDNPSCVEPVIAQFKRGLNDARWSSQEARAAGLRDIGIAQIGSAGVVNPVEFTKKLSEKYIRVLIPIVFRKVFPKDSACLEAALKCEELGTASAAYSAADSAADSAYSAADSAYSAAYSAADSAASAYRAADSAYSAAYSAADSAASAYRAADSAASAYRAADSAASAASAYSAAASAADSAASAYSAAASAADEILNLAASLALEVLRELKSPGCEWIELGRKS